VPGGNYDTDYYSHFSFVRTLQDIFGLADPGQPGTYMNRSKYTETFSTRTPQCCLSLRVARTRTSMRSRPMNHVYQSAGVTHVAPAGSATPPVTVGPDANQNNLWRTQ